MKAMLSEPRLPARRPESDNPFRVAIVYDDDDSGRSALEAYQILLSHVGHELCCRVTLWSFEILEKLRDANAVHDAAEADAIIVATRRRRDLPAAIRDWVEAWIPQKRGQAAVLIALLDLAPQQSRIRDFLKAAADSAGIDFLVQETGTEYPLWATQFGQPGCRLAPEGWGLND
jgi:hypothetical protein